jgi:hypothetical protein
VSRSVFESLAWLYAPAREPASAALVEAGTGWELRLPDEAQYVVWGRMPARGRPSLGAIRSLVARERALRAIRRAGPGLRHWGTQRIPPIGRRTPLLAATRFALLSGAVVRLGRGRVEPRVADSIAARAGHVAGPVRLAMSGDGSVRAILRGSGQVPTLLRLATVGGLKDAGRNSAALRRLGEAGVAMVPRLVDAGTMLDVGWSTESLLPGEPVRALSAQLIRDAVAWASTLPAATGRATALDERLALMLERFPASAAGIAAALDRVRARGRDVPGVMEHGDLWAGNLLALDDRLTGVVDWDNWHPAGIPGSDLLHLMTMARRSETRQEPGELWLERPWESSEFRDATDDYWRRLGLPLTDDLAWLAGLNWWAAHVAAGLRRGRQPTSDPAWVARNIDNVAAALAT